MNPLLSNNKLFSNYNILTKTNKEYKIKTIVIYLFLFNHNIT